jgi:Fe-S cluster biogenesis protein NfuA
MSGSQAKTLLEQVEAVVEIIRPALQADGGDVTLHRVDEAQGSVYLELLGACVSCPISSQTLNDGIERILKARVEGVRSVRHVGTLSADGELPAWAQRQ